MSCLPAPQQGWHRGCVTLQGRRAGGGGLPPGCLLRGVQRQQCRADVLLPKDSHGGRATCNL